MRTLLALMLREELRTHTTYSGRRRFFTFPVMVFIFSTIFALSMRRLLVETSLEQIAVLTHASVFLYGISVGSFGFLAKQYIERRYGTKNYLVTMPALHPVTYRQAFLALYLRDTIFYIALILLPGTLGLAIAAPFAGFKLTSIGLFFLSIVLSFQIGTSISFLGSVLYGRSKAAFALFTATIIGLVILGGGLRLFDIELLVPSLGFQLSVPPFGNDALAASSLLATSISSVLLMTVIGLFLVKVHYVLREDESHVSLLPRYRERFRFAGKYQELLGKEFVDLRRSGTVGKMFFSFVLPLVFLSFTSWFVNNGLGIRVGFNSVFYGAMVGYLGVLLYSWLNNVDSTDYYSLMPVTVPQVIKARIRSYLLLTTGISTAFVVIISALNGELGILWLSLLVMFITTVYMVAMTAYLTGLRTNTFLFDMDVLSKFAIMSFLPDVCLTILSFSLPVNLAFALSGIALVLFVLTITTWILYRGIEPKWSRTTFDA